MLMLITRLKAENISVRLYARGGHIDGISYGLEGIAFPGYRLGTAYSFKGLQRHLGIDHAPEQDELLRRVNLLTARECRRLLKQARTRGATALQADEMTTTQSALAQAMLPVALQVFEINHQAGTTQEIAPGVWRFSGKRYVTEYDATAGQLSLESGQGSGLRIRGQLEAASVRITEAQGIQADDLRVFQEIQRLIEAMPQMPSVEQASLQPGE